MTDSTDLRRKALWIKQRDHLSFETIAKRFGVRVFRGSKQTKAKRTRNQNQYGSPYIDESGFANEHGYAPIGTPCVGQHDW